MASPNATSAISPELVREHGLTEDEYQKILVSLGREPTLTELGIFSVMWSEHCSYKSSRVHLRRLPTRGSRVVQGPGENAGIIDVGEGWVCAFKIESHNHPSFIEPFQGAATGVGGILRDIFTMGARPLAVMDSLRFGEISSTTNHTKSAAESASSRNGGDSAIHKNHSILEGVVSGIASYGNCFGVPNVGGETRFDSCYSGNPLVNAFALGLARRDQIFYARAAGEGNPVIYVGAKTGRDGIHGATMASEEFREGSEQKRPNVQVGDPFLEKLLLEGCLEAMRSGAVVGIQDMGAAGLTCSTCEMGGRGEVGIEIELDRVPQRETGMSAYEIMLSESQERMLLVAERGREDEVFRIFEKWGLDAVAVGRVTSGNQMRVLQHGKVVAEIPNQSLTDDAPLYRRPLEPWQAPVPRAVPANLRLGLRAKDVMAKDGKARDGKAKDGKKSADFTPELKTLLASPNLCSKRWVHEQYDSMVQTNTVSGPGHSNQASDAGIIRIKGTSRALAMALDCNERWCYLDPKLGAMHAVAEAARKVACSGATPVAATNCLNFGNPEKPHIMWQFSEVVDGLAEACAALDTPITGGNVSFYNETLGVGIKPTPVVGVVGILEDVKLAVKSSFIAVGRDVLLLRPSPQQSSASATPHDPAVEFGSSEYAKSILGEIWGYPPALNLDREVALQKCLLHLAGDGLIESAHDCSDGGVAVALAECCFGHNVGGNFALASSGLPPELLLFAEDASRIVISCDPKHTRRIQQSAVTYSLVADLLGQTTAEKFEIKLDGAGGFAIAAPVSELKRVWEQALPAMLHVESREHLVPEVLQKS
jgi:phosphoribosylformylglycinamidine synthase